MKIFKSKQPKETVITRIEAQGQDFLNAFIDKPWNVDDLTANDIKKLEGDYFVQMVFNKLSGFIFIGKPTINVIDKKGNSREDVAQWLRPMMDELNLCSKMEASYHDLCIWGNYIHSIGLENDASNNVVISEIRRLPPSSFEAPGISDTSYDSIQGRLLHGISRDSEGAIHYWQRNIYGEVVELKNCEHFKSKVTSDYIDGTPLFNPLFKLIPKLTFLIDGMMIANNRDNIFFLRPSAESKPPVTTTKMSIWDYLSNVLRGFSRTLLHVLPNGVDIVEPSRPVSEVSLKSIDMVVKWIMGMYSSADIVSKGDEALIGGSDKYVAELAKNFSKSNQRVVVEIWTKVLNELLYMNGYGDLSVEICMEELSFNNDELDYNIGKEVLAAAKEGLVIASINEVRNRFKWEDADEEFIKTSKEEWVNAKIVKKPVESAPPVETPTEMPIEQYVEEVPKTTEGT